MKRGWVCGESNIRSRPSRGQTECRDDCRWAGYVMERVIGNPADRGVRHQARHRSAWFRHLAFVLPRDLRQANRIATNHHIRSSCGSRVGSLLLPIVQE